VSTVRDVFAPAAIFPLGFLFFYTIPYLHLVDYSDVIPVPGVRMASLAGLGLASYLVAVALGRLVWSTSGLAWPQIDAERWRNPLVPPLLVVLSIASLGALALVLRAGDIVPLLAANKETARFELATRVGYPLNAATRLPIPVAIACGLYLLLARRASSPSSVLVGCCLAASIAAEALLAHRGLPLFILAPLLVCFHYLVRPIGPRLLAGAGALLIVGMGIASSLRLATSPPQLAHLLSHSRLPPWMPAWCTAAVTVVAFGPLTFNLVLDRMPGSTPFQHGMALVNGAFGILPGHQPVVGEFVSRTLLGQPEGSPGLPPTILGGFYIDFGIAGIVGGMLLVGLLTQFLYWRTFARPSPWSTFLYAYWYFNLFVALYGDFIANDFIWALPLAVYCIEVAVRCTSRLRQWYPGPGDGRPAAAT